MTTNLTSVLVRAARTTQAALTMRAACAVACLFVSGSALAQTTITFDTIVPAFPASTISNCFAAALTVVAGQGACASSFDIDGYRFTTQGSGVGSLTPTRVATFADNGSTYLSMSALQNDALTVRQANATSFDLSSFSLAEAPVQLSWEQHSLLVTGTRANGSTVTQSVLFDRQYDGLGPRPDFQSVTLSPSFTDLVSVSFAVGAPDPRCTIECYTASGFAIDNLALRATAVAPVTAIPEPGTWAMMLLPVGVMALVAHRRRRSSQPAN